MPSEHVPPIPDEELAAMLERAERATPGPWEYESVHERSERTAWAKVWSHGGKVLFDTVNSDAALIYEENDEDGVHRWDETGNRNLDFASHARTDLPRVVRRLRQVERENEQLRAQVSGHCDRIAAQSELLSKKAEKEASS